MKRERPRDQRGALGILLLHYGFGRLDARISRAMWLRRAAAAILLAAGIILYSPAKPEPSPPAEVRAA